MAGAALSGFMPRAIDPFTRHQGQLLRPDYPPTPAMTTGAGASRR